MRKCPVCKETKSRDEFYKRRDSHDGLSVYCKACSKKKSMDHYHKNKKRRTKLTEFYHSRYLERIRAPRRRTYFEKYPERSYANQAVKYAILRGDMERPCECNSCGVGCFPDGHHDDYGKPLDVKWLCKSCHKTLHVSMSA